MLVDYYVMLSQPAFVSFIVCFDMRLYSFVAKSTRKFMKYAQNSTAQQTAKAQTEL
jgi:hypothetical protein